MRMLGERYRLEQRIGVGGMSEVWRGHDRVLDRPVAIKLIGPAREPDACYDQVRTEARSAARLAHPNVAGVHDFGLAPVSPHRHAPYIVMELVEGDTLADHLRAGPLDWRIAVRVCAEVSAALAAAHVHRIVHRDIKPANIILTPAGAKVLDFGIAATAGQCEEHADGIVMGTPAYVAPERFAGVAATPAADMYSLGVLLHHCLVGQLPWPVITGTQLVRARPDLEPDPLPAIDGLPSEVADLCASCLSRDPAKRPTSLMAALLLSETVDARVYVPLLEASTVRPRPPQGAPWDQRAADAATDAVGRSDNHVGRHRA